MQLFRGASKRQRGLLLFAGMLDVAAFVSFFWIPAVGFDALVWPMARLIASVALVVAPFLVLSNEFGVRETLASWTTDESSTPTTARERPAAGPHDDPGLGSGPHDDPGLGSGPRDDARARAGPMQRVAVGSFLVGALGLALFLPLTFGGRYTDGVTTFPSLASVLGVPRVLPLGWPTALVLFATGWTILVVDRAREGRSSRS